jgi:RNA polymerase sigma factor (sigma-70 family)
MDAQSQPIDDQVTAVYLEHQPALERYTRSLTRDEDRTADVCQEVFIRLLVTARAGQMPDSPAAWMHRVSHNLVVSAARRKSTTERSLDDIREFNDPRSTEDLVLRRERDREIGVALDNVRPFERRAIVLAAQGYRADEIGDQLGRSALATRTLMCRARGRLRSELAGADAA